MTKFQREVYRTLAPDGWRVRPRPQRHGRRPQRTHIQLEHPSGGVITVSGTPTCHRAYKNLLAQARQEIRRAEAGATRV